MADAAGHSFLVALIVTRTLLSLPGLPDPANSRWRASLPGTAADAMHADLETRLGAAAERARDLLRPLAFAAGAGLPWESIWAALASTLSGRSYTDEDLIWLRRQAGSYVVEAMESDRSVYRLYHAALAEYLRQGRDEAGVHGAFTAFLFSRVPAAARGLDWGRAHPYARAHLATHAQRAGTGQLDHLLCDPGYLINAVPAGVLAALPAARAPAAERAGVAYQRAVHQFRGQPEEQRASYLEFAARIARAPELAAQVDARFPQRVWSIPWTHWPPEYPHRVLGGHLDALSGVLVVSTLEGKHVVVSIGEDANLRTWDLATAEPTGVYPVGAAPLVAARAVQLADHQVIIAVLSSDGLLHLWDLGTATLLRTVSVIPAWRRRLAPLLPLDLTLECLTVPGERHFAFVGVRGRGASVWELPSGRQVADLRPPANAAEIGYLETAGGRVVLVARTGVSEHWVLDVQEMRELPVDRGHARRSVFRSLREVLGVAPQVRFYAYPGGEPAVAVQYSGRSAVVWDLAVSRPLGTWPASMTNASVRLASGNRVTVPLDLAEKNPDLTRSGLQPLGDPRTRHAGLGESDRLPATPAGRFLHVELRRESGQTRSVTLAGHTGDVTSYDILPVADGHVVVTASWDGTVRRWDILRSKGWEASEHFGPVGERETLGMNRIESAGLVDGVSIGIASDANGGFAVWDLRTGRRLRIVGASASTSAISVARLGGEPVAVFPNGAQMTIVRLPYGPVTRWPSDLAWWPNDIASAALADGSGVVVTSGHGRKAVVWDLDTGRMRRVLASHRGWTSCVERAQGSGNESVVLTGGFDNRVNVWDLSRGWHRRFRVVRRWAFLAEPSAGHARAIRTVRLADGRMLVIVATLDGMARVLEAPETMRHVRRTGAILADVATSATLTNGLIVVVTATDGIVRVWDAAKFPLAEGIAPLCEINVEVPVTDLDATEHDTVVLATPNGLTAIRLDARSLIDQVAHIDQLVS